MKRRAEPGVSASKKAKVDDYSIILREIMLNIQREQLEPLVDSLGTMYNILDTENPSECAFLKTYLDISPQATHFLDLWGSSVWKEDKKRDMFAPTMEILVAILKYKHVHDAAGAETLAISILKTKMEWITKHLSWSDKPHIEYATLSLCTAMVSTSKRVAREFVRLFDFGGKVFQKLVTRRTKDYTVPNTERIISVRRSFIELVLELTASKDEHVYRFMVKADGTTSSVFKSLDADTFEDVEWILSTLSTTVLAKNDTQHKYNVFSMAAITQLLKLLESEDERIPEISTKYLRLLFFSPNALYHTSQTSTLPFLSKRKAKDHLIHTNESESSIAIDIVNKVVGSFNISTSFVDPKREALLLEFIQHYPGLAFKMLESFLVVVQPRMSYKWFAATSFVIKVLNLPLAPLESSLYELASPESLEGIMRLILPVAIQKQVLSKALQSSEPLVVFTTLNLLTVVMNRVAQLHKMLVPEISKLLEKELRSMLPPPELILTLCSKYRHDDSAAGTKSGLIHARSLSVLRMYFIYLPLVMSETKFDISKLIASSSIMSPTASGALLQLLRVAEPNRLSWIVLCGDSTKFKALSQCCLSKHSTIATLARHVVRRILQSLHIFGMTAKMPHEIDVWLHHLTLDAIDFFDQLVRNVALNPFACIRGSSLSPMTRALVAYFQLELYPLPLKGVDPSLASVYGASVLRTILVLTSSTHELSLNDQFQRDPISLVESYSKATTSLLSKHPTIAIVPKRTKSIENLKNGESLVLTEKLLLSALKESGSFDSIENYFSSHSTASIFDSPEMQSGFERLTDDKSIIQHFFRSVSTITTLRSLFAPFIALRGLDIYIPKLNVVIDYLKKESTGANKKEIQMLASLDIVYGLSVYLSRVNRGLKSPKGYCDLVGLSVSVLHHLLATISKEATNDTFWQQIWHYQGQVIKSLSEKFDVVLLKWALVPYSLASLLPKAHLPVLLTHYGKTSPLVITMANHATLSEIHDLLDDLLTQKSNAQLVSHILELCQHEAQPVPGLFEKVFGFASMHQADVAPLRWMNSYLKHHRVPSDDTLLALYESCWSAHDEVHVVLMQELIRNHACCRVAFESTKDTKSVSEDMMPALLKLCATYLNSSPIASDCVSWIEGIIVPSFIDSVMVGTYDNVRPLIQIYDAMESNLNCSDDLEWLGDLMKKKKSSLSNAQLQVLLLVVQHYDLTSFAFKMLQFTLHQLQHTTDEAQAESFAFMAENILTKYVGSMKKLPLIAIDAFKSHLDNFSSWHSSQSLLGLIKTIAVLVPSINLAPSATSIVHAIDTIELTPALLETFTAILATNECSSDIVNENLLKTLLPHYTASLSRVDCALKLLFELVESKYNVLLENVHYCFGKASNATSIALSSHAQHWLLEEIEPQRMRKSIEFFPLGRAFTIGVYNTAEEDTVYDPSFFLPLVAHTLSTSHIPDKQLLQSGILGYALCALSAEDDSIRSYAYGIVASAHEAMSATARSTDFNERRQIYLLLETLKNGITSVHERLPSLLTVFANDAISVLLRPGHFMYPLINAFLLARSALDISDVPMFYTLFNSSSITYRQERSWLLHIIKRGVRLDIDVDLLQRRHVFAILLSFFDSPLADAYTQDFVLHIISRSVQTPHGSLVLVHKGGLIQWIECMTIKYFDKPSVVQWLLTIASDAISNYDLPENASTKYRANSIIQLKQMCTTLVNYSNSLNSEAKDLLRTIFLKYFQLAIASHEILAEEIGLVAAIGIWFSLDLTTSSTKLVQGRDIAEFLDYIAHCFEWITEASTAIDFQPSTYSQWAQLTAFVCSYLSSTASSWKIKENFPKSVHKLMGMSSQFAAAVEQSLSAVHVHVYLKSQ
ncbi:hypothetical protein THRCLA_03986 [Thraustotheca clavata]|uniref:Nucleolar pre-ribosomal-associated protein 1 C-terminal domain-containing protein n=1 Tax=Thraustotheca clavata TaxID=74557 RepID=A0A1W0A0G1_9STRA|nr:hypothetical protein THRCLA_03986 [Thraustotheca clavata]